MTPYEALQVLKREAEAQDRPELHAAYVVMSNYVRQVRHLQARMSCFTQTNMNLREVMKRFDESLEI